MSNDDHQFIWALENGSQWDTVDDDDANYHAECGDYHTPGAANCPLEQEIRYQHMSEEELLAELDSARRWLQRAVNEKQAAARKIVAVGEWLKWRSANE